MSELNTNTQTEMPVCSEANCNQPGDRKITEITTTDTTSGSYRTKPLCSKHYFDIIDRVFEENYK